MQLTPIPSPKSTDYKVNPMKSAKIHSDFIGGMAIWEDHIVSSSEDGKLMFTRFGNLAGKKRLLELGGAINHLCFSDDYTLLATASDDKKVRIFNTESWELILEFTAHDSYVTKVLFAEKYLISCSHDATAKIWKHETGELIHTLTGHQHWVYTMAVSPNRKQLLTTSNNCSVKVWDIESGQEIKELVAASTLVYASDGMSLIIGGSNDTDIGNKDFPNASIWPTDGYAYTCGRDVVCWNTADWSIKWQIDLSYDAVRAIVHLPQFNLLIAVSDSIYGINPDNGEMEFSHKNVNAIPIFSCAVINDDWLATGDRKGNISVWAIDEFISGGKSVAFGGDVYKPMYIESAQRVIAGSWLGGEVSLWSKTGQLVATFRGFPSGRDNCPIATLPTAPHKVLITGEGTLKIIDTMTAKIADAIPLDMSDLRITEAFFINEEECILSITSNEPRLVNIKTKEVRVIPCNYSLGGENFRLNDDLLLLQPSFYKDNVRRGENAVSADFSWEFGMDKPLNIRQKEAPLVVFNIQTKKIEHEWWFPHDQVVEKDWSFYAWPIVGGQNNSIIAASYLKEKMLYLWEVGKEEPLKIIDMASYCSGSYNSLYGIYANEKYLFFRTDSLLLKYDIRQEKWSKQNASGYKYTVDEKKGWIALLENNNTLSIWDMESGNQLLNYNIGFPAERIVIADYLYLYSKEKGMLVYEMTS